MLGSITGATPPLAGEVCVFSTAVAAFAARPVAAVSIDGDGNFKIPKLPAGEYVMTATLLGGATAYAGPFDVGRDPAIPATVELPLNEMRREFSGSVRNVSSGDRKHILVRAFRLGDRVQEIYCSSLSDEGRYVFKVPDGEHFIVADGPGYTIAGRRAGPAKDEERTLTLNIELSPLGAMATPKQVADWVQNSMISLGPAASSVSLAEFGKRIGDATLVGMGEATHGTREFVQLRSELLKYLIEERGFSVLAIEAGWNEARALDDYVVHGRGDLEQGLAGLEYWIWDTHEFLDVLRWLRHYNSNLRISDRVRVYGFDMVYTRSGAKQLEQFVSKRFPKRGDNYAETFRFLQQTPAEIRQVENTLREKTLTQLEGLATLIRGLEAGSYSPEDQGEREQAIANIEVIRQAIEMYSAVGLARADLREQAMAANLLRILRLEAPGAKVVAWGHNAHIGKGRVLEFPLMGAYLEDELKDSYLAIGAMFGQGWAFVPMILSLPRVKEFTIHAPARGTVEEMFKQMDERVFLVDLRSAKGPTKRWFAAPQDVRSVSAVYGGGEKPPSAPRYSTRRTICFSSCGIQAGRRRRPQEFDQKSNSYRRW